MFFDPESIKQRFSVLFFFFSFCFCFLSACPYADILCWHNTTLEVAECDKGMDYLTVGMNCVPTGCYMEHNISYWNFKFVENGSSSMSQLFYANVLISFIFIMFYLLMRGNFQNYVITWFNDTRTCWKRWLQSFCSTYFSSDQEDFSINATMW